MKLDRNKLANIVVKASVACLAVCMLAARAANAHGRMLEPPARNTLWRFEAKAPTNYNDNELFCGGIRGITTNKGKCGVCGDPYDGERLHETGGSMALNTTVRNYFPGSSLDIMIEIVANHGGLFRFEMCWRNDGNERETEDCFEPLALSGRAQNLQNNNQDDDESYMYDYELDPSVGNGFVTVSLDLPPNKTCDKCILRWHWTVANNWGTCEDGTEAIGCGYQEVYRNCADVSISRSGAGIGFGHSERRRKRQVSAM